MANYGEFINWSRPSGIKAEKGENYDEFVISEGWEKVTCIFVITAGLISYFVFNLHSFIMEFSNAMNCSGGKCSAHLQNSGAGNLFTALLLVPFVVAFGIYFLLCLKKWLTKIVVRVDLYTEKFSLSRRFFFFSNTSQVEFTKGMVSVRLLDQSGLLEKLLSVPKYGLYVSDAAAKETTADPEMLKQENSGSSFIIPADLGGKKLLWIFNLIESIQGRNEKAPRELQAQGILNFFGKLTGGLRSGSLKVINEMKKMKKDFDIMRSIVMPPGVQPGRSAEHPKGTEQAPGEPQDRRGGLQESEGQHQESPDSLDTYQVENHDAGGGASSGGWSSLDSLSSSNSSEGSRFDSYYNDDPSNRR